MVHASPLGFLLLFLPPLSLISSLVCTPRCRRNVSTGMGTPPASPFCSHLVRRTVWWVAGSSSGVESVKQKVGSAQPRAWQYSSAAVVCSCLPSLQPAERPRPGPIHHPITSLHSPPAFSLMVHCGWLSGGRCSSTGIQVVRHSLSPHYHCPCPHFISTLLHKR